MVSDVGGVRVEIVNSPFCHPRLEVECGYSLNRVSGCLSFFPGCSDRIGRGGRHAEGGVSAHAICAMKPLFRPLLEKDIFGCIFGCINRCRGT
jgi:hypothetical protein